jgi:hypothetical protein
MIVYTTNITEHDNWYNVEKNIMNINKEGIFVSFCDIYFKNTNNPITELWYGIIHNPINWEKYTPWGDKTNLFNVDSFINSLKFCKILFVMAETQINPIINLLELKGFTNIKVLSLIHPINKLNYNFNYDKYILNKKKTIYSIGNWLRKQYTIFKLKCNKNKFNKAIIPFTNRTKLELEYYLKYDNMILTKMENNSVKKLEYISINDYHKIFENNLVFLDVYLTTINNTFLEAIISDTPIILNRKQEYVDLIGPNYPLFFDNIDDINSYIEDDNNILKAHNYLKNIDKTKFTIEYFIDNLKEKLGVVE